MVDQAAPLSAAPRRIPARFEFDAGLAHFLAREHRGHAFACDCPPDATLKHMVEALGVPHTEIGQLLIQGRAVTLQDRVQAGDQVQVMSKKPGLSDWNGPAPRFIADAHLGGLARLLRMAGFDTLYDNAADDREIVRLAGAHSRVLLTRDRDLLKHRDVKDGCYLRAIIPEQQFLELAIRLGLDGRARPFSLCLNCNLPLEAISSEQAQEKVPAGVLARQSRFSTCPACERIYWEGSHWRHMRQLLGELLQAARQPA